MSAMVVHLRAGVREWRDIFLLCAVLFHAPGIEQKFLKLWWLLLPLDVLWSLAPFLLLHHIRYGLALACMTPLVYSPFAQRSLILVGADRSSNATTIAMRSGDHGQCSPDRPA